MDSQEPCLELSDTPTLFIFFFSKNIPLESFVTLKNTIFFGSYHFFLLFRTTVSTCQERRKKHFSGGGATAPFAPSISDAPEFWRENCSFSYIESCDKLQPLAHGFKSFFLKKYAAFSHGTKIGEKGEINATQIWTSQRFQDKYEKVQETITK